MNQLSQVSCGDLYCCYCFLNLYCWVCFPNNPLGRKQVAFVTKASFGDD